MKLTIIIELEDKETVPKSPILSPEAIEGFKKRHPTLQSIAAIIVKKEENYTLSVNDLPKYISTPEFGKGEGKFLGYKKRF